MATIIEVAEYVAKPNTEALKKAKELGFKVKAVNSSITDEEAVILSDYLSTGEIPESFKALKAKRETEAKATKVTKATKTTPVTKTTKARNGEKKLDSDESLGSDSLGSDKSLESGSLESKDLESSGTKTKKTTRARKPKDFSESLESGESSKEDSKPKTTLATLSASDTTMSTPLVILPSGKMSAGKMSSGKMPSDEITIEDVLESTKSTTARQGTQGEIESEISTQDSNPPETTTIEAKEPKAPRIPQGFDPSALKRPIRVSAIRVISKNDKSKDPKPKLEDSMRDLSTADKKRSASQILDSLRQTDYKEKDKKKKKEKIIIKEKPRHNTHIIEMERDISVSVSSYDDEQDEIMLMDVFEMPNESYEDEKTKKAEINEKIKLNRYSPWMKEGSIARSSKGRSRRGGGRDNRDSQVITSLVLPEEIRVYEFAERANLELGNVLGKLFMLGVKVLKNDFLDKDTIEILASEYNIDVSIHTSGDMLEREEDEAIESNLVVRPPVVTIMGHVDHGKTSLLDYIRNSRVARSEAGGITQHIGAYMVEKNGKKISFIDTPGHEAFTQMRMRGAQVTDIAIIVIAADDGVKQQTIEALNHAKSANVQIIIAMNKMDKAEANPDKLKAECAELGFNPVEWGGEYEFIPISAKSGQGVDILLETILLQAEILELRASVEATPKAVVLEGSQQIGKGSVATIIVRQGILEVGQSIVADVAYGKIRTLRDDTGKNITKLEPSGVAQITGLSEVPQAGTTLYVVENDSIAREIANKRSAYLRQKQLSKSTKVTFDELSSMVAKGQIKSLPIILRADTQGSLEAIKSSLERLNNNEVEINIISLGIGGITQSDIDLANASTNCIVLGFNVRPTSEIKNLAKDLDVVIKSYSIIYDLIDDIKALLGGLMSPIIEEEIIGLASVREIFNVAKLGTIAGCMVTDGKVEKSLDARVLRNGVIMWSGKLASLKRFKDDVKEVAKGYECGIMFEGFNDIALQDELEIFRKVEKQRVL